MKKDETPEEWLKFIAGVKKISVTGKIQDFEKKQKRVERKFCIEMLDFGLQNQKSNRLDLHGMSAEEAFIAVKNFIDSAHAQKIHEIEIITGVGGRGDADFRIANGFSKIGVLKRELPIWLEREEIKCKISSFAPALSNPLKNGAFRVFLKKRK